MNRSLKHRALTYLGSHRVMTVATRTPEDLWAAAVFYVNEEFSLFFLSADHTRHAQHIAADSRVAATIQEDYADWQTIKGIQLEGRAHQLAGAQRDRAIELYGKKYPFLRAAPDLVAAALLQVNWYCLTPERLFFVDNSRGFGHRDELLL